MAREFTPSFIKAAGLAERFGTEDELASCISQNKRNANYNEYVEVVRTIAFQLEKRGHNSIEMLMRLYKSGVTSSAINFRKFDEVANAFGVSEGKCVEAIKRHMQRVQLRMPFDREAFIKELSN